MSKQFHEIFRAGKYPQRNVTEEEIKAIADNYDPEFQEAPVAIFHKSDGLAYAWVESLKAVGPALLASFKDVTEELKQLTAEKKLKRHSIELYSDLSGKGPYLKGLAMLGVEAPAVKGMKAIEFAEGENETFEFEETPSFANDLAVDYFKEKFEESEKALADEKKKVSQFEDETKSTKFEQRKTEFVSFMEQDSDKGSLPPVLKNLCVDLFTHLDPLEAGEGEKKPVEIFKELIGAIKQQPPTGEQFKGGTDPVEFTAEELAEKITEYRDEQAQKGRVVSYSDALNHVKNQK